MVDSSYSETEGFVARLKLYQSAVAKWGQDAQLRMLQEECCELGAEVNKCFRNKGLTHQLIEEMVDVEIMVEQIKFCVLTDEEIGQYVEIQRAKLYRLKERLERD